MQTRVASLVSFTVTTQDMGLFVFYVAFLVVRYGFDLLGSLTPYQKTGRWWMDLYLLM